jgi:acyl-CoA dehydrogenase
VALQFAKDEVLPKAADHDRTGAFPWELVKKAHALGLMNPMVPEKYGWYINPPKFAAI